ncbi:cupin domain-containing protein [Legionella gresilensis]|uniref:cupin domain-containing protein n=1 Tax=Legionella gresilensis TaxID=91823 RepID=UPI0010413E58|nr:cupin domain-containing protein [Legionella gresilensis]
MINFRTLTVSDFLRTYWQKKPLVLENAIPDFNQPLLADELAGLAMEDEIESRLVRETPKNPPYWLLQRGPFTEKDFSKLPKSHWTLLVQGVDRFIPEVAALLDNFNFLPQWRVDDVMISYAVEQGSVGPHYDNYDVFLYQAQGSRKWLLTTQNCHAENYIADLELRIMKQFNIEQEIILHEGDMLYLPPHIGHHGIALSNDCMTYSFGYRSYTSSEMWDSLSEYLLEHKKKDLLYEDPSWFNLQAPAEIPKQACQQAQELLKTVLKDDILIGQWFGSFITMLDRHAESILPTLNKKRNFTQFLNKLKKAKQINRNTLCRFAYINDKNTGLPILYINGEVWETTSITPELVRKIANHRCLALKELLPFVDKNENQQFLYKLWQLQWIEFTNT